MSQSAEEIRHTIRPNTEIKARKKACVTSIEEADDVVREESGERRNKKELNDATHLPFRRHVIREGDERRTVSNQLRKADKSQRSIWTACSWATRRKDKPWHFLVARERATIVVLSAVIPRKSTGEKICRKLMARLREIG